MGFGRGLVNVFPFPLVPRQPKLRACQPLASSPLSPAFSRPPCRWPRRRRRYRPRPMPSPRRRRRRSACRPRASDSESLIVLNARGAQAGRCHAHARERRAVGHPVHQPAGARRRAHADRRAGRPVGDRQLRQGPAQRHRLGLRQGRLEGRPTRSWCCASPRSRATGSPSTWRCWRAAWATSTGRPRCSSTRSGSASARAASTISARARPPAARRRRSAARATPAPSRAGPIRHRAAGLPVLPAHHRLRAERSPTARLISPACGAPPLLPCY